MLTITNTLPAPASFWRRNFAFLYDSLFLMAGWLLCTVVVVLLHHGQAIAAGTFWYRCLLLCVPIAFYTGFWTTTGQTPGMATWQIKVCTIQGHKLSFLQAFLRLVLAVIALAPLGLGFLWQFFNCQRCTWHDYWSKSRVVMLSC